MMLQSFVYPVTHDQKLPLQGNFLGEGAFDRASLGKQKIVTSYDNIDFGVDY